MNNPAAKTRRPLWIILAVVAVLALAGGAYLLTRSESDGPTMDAATVLDRLKAAGLPITNSAIQDESTDPNHKLGRPGQYTSRASFDVPGGDEDASQFSTDRGGAIEVFPDSSGAKERSSYIQGILKASPILGAEYHYRNGGILVRITSNVVPSQAAKFGDAVKAFSST